MAGTIATKGPSHVAPSVTDNYIIKLVTSRTFHERIKALWMHSRLHKEIRGNRLLKRAGVCVPDIVESGYHPLPVIGTKFLGYYIMNNLTRDGYVELASRLECGQLSTDVSDRVLQNIIRDIRKMAAASIVFSDLHLGNILVNEYGDIAWIDTGVSHYHFGRRYKFRKKYNDSIRRLLKQPLLPSLSGRARDAINGLMLP